jgi:hypothetical protein
MSAETVDHVAHAHHFGRTLYAVDIVVWVDDEPTYPAQRVCPNNGLAKSWASRIIPHHPGSYAVIRRGAWERDTFDDIPGGYGRIDDAVWVVDDDWGCDGYPDDDGTIRWEEWP